MGKQLMTIVTHEWLMENTEIKPHTIEPFYFYMHGSNWDVIEYYSRLLELGCRLVKNEELFEAMKPKVIDNERDLRQAVCNLAAKHGFKNVKVRYLGNRFHNIFWHCYDSNSQDYTYKILPDETERHFTTDLLESN